ncbi:helix-turn-helix transcriptional regulator [uncultured Draconibacterium sp.]|uniref:helix-turn-helix domain-containing protein n=1 Tax=uncultured Draconibacterium sp. TaxID=1573823 RepID=UPI0029C61DD4|nr:helix-turn-helix transcriptional regulator [uncultured Draconibacterium sp.]
MNIEKINTKRMSNYLDKNRDKIDETIVSLRILKEIDSFLESKSVKRFELAEKVKSSESYISQLMSGTKKINTSFINRFEKAYNVTFKYVIQENEKVYDYYKSIHSSNEVSLHFKKADLYKIEQDNLATSFVSIKYNELNEK